MKSLKCGVHQEHVVAINLCCEIEVCRQIAFRTVQQKILPDVDTAIALIVVGFF